MTKKSEKIDYKVLSETLQSEIKKLHAKLETAQEELHVRNDEICTYYFLLNAYDDHFRNCISYTGVVTKEDVDYARNLANRILKYQPEIDNKPNS
ncbi:hypothetical protein EB118_20165 [bacterium]|nr:hypothetical protein [bacterium]NDG32378.1 hypothetical protein [bacterium]